MVVIVNMVSRLTLQTHPFSTWDLVYLQGIPCYVSGHYTDAECGMAKLGSCNDD